MKIKVLEAGKWGRVCGTMESKNGDFCCTVEDFLRNLGPNYEKAASGMVQYFAMFAESRDRDFHDGMCHQINAKYSIYEFIKGQLRILWFYGKGEIIICCNGFPKKSKKTPTSDINVAIKLRNQYFDALEKHLIEFIEED